MREQPSPPRAREMRLVPVAGEGGRTGAGRRGKTNFCGEGTRLRSRGSSSQIHGVLHSCIVNVRSKSPVTDSIAEKTLIARMCLNLSMHFPGLVNRYMVLPVWMPIAIPPLHSIESTIRHPSFLPAKTL